MNSSNAHARTYSRSSGSACFSGYEYDCLRVQGMLIRLQLVGVSARDVGMAACELLRCACDCVVVHAPAQVEELKRAEREEGFVARPKRPRVLIVGPTKELAEQVLLGQGRRCSCGCVWCRRYACCCAWCRWSRCCLGRAGAAHVAVYGVGVLHVAVHGVGGAGAVHAAMFGVDEQALLMPQRALWVVVGPGGA